MTSAGGLSGTEEGERGGQCEGWEGIGGPGGCGLLGLGHQGSELGKKTQRSEGVSAIWVLQGSWLLNDKVWGCGNGPQLGQRTRSGGGARVRELGSPVWSLQWPALGSRGPAS